MCASAAPAVDKGLQSALRRPGEEGTAGSAGANARGGAGSPSPKRVTFALPAPPAGTLAASSAAAHLQHAQPAGRSRAAAAPLPPPALAHAAPAALRTAADELLCFLHEVDSPRRPTSPLGPVPLASSRRWPSNEALVASDAEIAGAVDMSDLPLSPRTPPASPAGLAQAFFDLMPQQRLARAASLDAAGAARGTGAGPAGEAAASAAGEQAAFAATAAEAEAEAEAEAGGGSPLAALTRLLCRFLSAAATSGSSIAELAAANTGSRLCSGFSRSASVDTLYSARSSSSELSAYGSACSDDEL